MSTTEKAREILLEQIEQRLAILREFEDAEEKRGELSTRLDAAAALAVEKWEALTKAGWSDRELRALGLSAPTVPITRPRRPRRKVRGDEPTAPPAATATEDE